MASVSFSCEQSVAKKLDKYRARFKLGSRTKAIEHLLKYANVNQDKMIYFDQNGEPINEFLEYLNSNEKSN
tara:strand:- start:87 stop:299 length:213 start_codon:yes stop_codon:yes gene_type:complete